MTERWKDIKGFEGAYFVSDLGRVRSAKRYRVSGRILTPCVAGKGYRKVQLVVGEKNEHRYVHELVLTHFVGPRPKGMDAAHNNGHRDDNRLANLRWATRTDNHADKIEHGTACRGERHGQRKLSEADVRGIRSSTDTCASLAAQFGVGPMQISRIRTRKNWGHVE